jgi:UDP-N-acetylmuramate--alanine ligase
VGEVNGIVLVDDYGHHPTEIKATLEAAATLDFKRIVCVFQPHRYSRTEALRELFGTAFDDVDVLFVMDVFSAGETPIPGISGKTVANEVKSKGNVEKVSYIANRRTLVDELVRELKPGDLVITQGAGDVTLIGPALLAALEETYGTDAAADSK